MGLLVLVGAAVAGEEAGGAAQRRGAVAPPLVDHGIIDCNTWSNIVLSLDYLNLTKLITKLIKFSMCLVFSQLQVVTFAAVEAEMVVEHLFEAVTAGEHGPDLLVLLRFLLDN